MHESPLDWHSLVNWMRKRLITLLLMTPVLLTLQAGAQQSPAKPDNTGQQAEPLTTSDLVIQQILEPLRTGIITQNVKTVLSVFDKNELNGYGDLDGQLHAFFQQFQETSFRYQLMQVTEEKDHGSATVEMEMDALPYETTRTAVRRSVQMRLQLKLGPKGWKVAAFTPADFFNVQYSGTSQQ